jgi:cell division protein FtsQ
MQKVLNNSKTVNNQLIEKRRKRKKVKRGLLLIVILISVSITLCLKLPYFNIKAIEVTNNRNIPSQEIIDLSNLKLEKNIFYLDFKEVKTNILTNSYILNVQLKRKLPNKINISVEERTAIFYIKKENKYLIVDNEGIILEEKELINNMKLIKLEGFDKSIYEVGKKLGSEEEKIRLIGEITKLIKNLNEGVPEPSIVNLMNNTDIKILYGDMEIRIGTSYELAEKYNKALNILIQNKLLGKKGYIDVSYKGEPVFLVSD